MQVKQILSGKPEGGVITVPPSMSVAEVTELLSVRKIGAVVVSSDGQSPEGILSERDIVRALSKRGGDCLLEEAREIMTPDPVTCALSERTAAVFSKMTEGRFRHLPVVDEGVMVGLISIGDVVKAQRSELHMEKKALEGMIMGVEVGGLMPPRRILPQTGRKVRISTAAQSAKRARETRPFQFGIDKPKRLHAISSHRTRGAAMICAINSSGVSPPMSPAEQVLGPGHQPRSTPE